MRPTGVVDVGEHGRAACSVSRVGERRSRPRSGSVSVREVGAAGAGLVAGAEREEEVGARTRFASRGEHGVGRRPRRRARRPRPRSRSRRGDRGAERGEPGGGGEEARGGPSRRRGSRRSVSRSRTARDRARRRARRRRSSAARVAGPHDAVGARGRRSRWNSRSARLGLGAEDAVLAAGVEAERVEAALELGDVVAAQHRPARGRAGGRRGGTPLSTSAAQVSGPQMPSTRSPRASWNARTALRRSRRRTTPSDATVVNPAAVEALLEVADDRPAHRRTAAASRPRHGSGRLKR